MAHKDKKIDEGTASRLELENKTDSEDRKRLEELEWEEEFSMR